MHDRKKTAAYGSRNWNQLEIKKTGKKDPSK